VTKRRRNVMKILSELGFGLKFNLSNQKNRKENVLIIITLLLKKKNQLEIYI
jgi:hypothetical protein